MAKSHSLTVALWVGIKARHEKNGRKEKSSVAAGQDIRATHEEVESFVHKLSYKKQRGQQCHPVVGAQQEDECTHFKPHQLKDLVDSDIQERVGAYRQADIL
jgi:hypothetical protein